MAYKPIKKEKLYSQFEEAVFENTSDDILLKILSNFTRLDFLQFSILFKLIIARRFYILDLLYDIKVPFSYVDSWKGTILHVACGAAGSFEAVKFLFDRNILTDVNLMTDEKETPFLLAVMYEDMKTIKFFLENANPKPDLSIQSVYGDTAFSLARKAKNKDLLPLLKHYAEQENFVENS